MRQRHSLAVVAGAATVLGAIPLSSIYASFTWLIYASVAVGAIVAAAVGTRSARGPVWTQVLAMLAALLLCLTFLFPSGKEFLRLIPSGSTFEYFNALLGEAGQAIRDEAVPVADFDGLLLLTTAGVGLVAIMVDFFAVGIRRAALAGLPMLAIYSVPVAVLSHSVSPFTFVFAAAGYLWLLVADNVDRVRRFGRRFTGEGRDVDLWEPSPLSAAGRRLSVAGIALAVLLPLAVPGMTSALLDTLGPRSGTGTGTGTGGGDAPSVDLFALLRGNLSQDQVFTMAEVTTNDPAPYYLRFGVADQVTEDGFINRAPSNGTAVTRGLPKFSPPTAFGVTAERHSAQVRVIGLDMRLAPVYQQVVSTDGLDGSWSFDPSTDQIFSRRSSINKRTYRFEYVRLGYTPDALRTAAPFTGGVSMTRLTAVPPVKQVTDLVERLTEGKQTQYDKVRAIYNHFSPANGFVYSTETETPTGANAIVDFLDSRKGYCVQYAAAMAWLVRAAGYPARVAFGFARGRPVTVGTYSLTNLNLHAWTEVLFPGFGWVPFDATPAQGITGSVSSAWAPDLANPEPTVTASDPGVVNPSTDPSGSAGRGPLEGEGAPEGPGANGNEINYWLIAGGVAATLLLVFLIAPSLQRRVLRRRRRARSGEVIELDGDVRGSPRPTAPVIVLDPAAVATARRDAHAAWAELLDTMIDYSVAVDAAETPRATATRLGRLRSLDPAVRTDARLLASAEERARYARMPLRPDGLERSVRAIRSALAARATGRQRLIAALMPPSVLLRWRTIWTGWMSNALAARARVRDLVLSVTVRRSAVAGRKARTSP